MPLTLRRLRGIEQVLVLAIRAGHGFGHLVYRFLVMRNRNSIALVLCGRRAAKLPRGPVVGKLIASSNTMLPMA